MSVRLRFGLCLLKEISMIGRRGTLSLKLAWAVACLGVLSLLPTAHCLLPAAQADDWPQWLGPKRDGVWRETELLDKFPESGPTIRWRTPIGAGYAGPAVVGGRVFVTDRVLDQGKNNPK